MKRTLASSGFTIIEVMIVLIISGGMLVSVATMISGQQRRTEFITATREMESKMRDIFNDVESGLSLNTGQLTCTSDPASTSGVTILAGSAEQGTNRGCIFLGKAVHFYNGTDGLRSEYTVMPIVGKREYQDGARKLDVLNINDAKPDAFWKDGGPISYETGQLRNGLQVTDVMYFNPAGSTSSKSLAVFSAIGAGGTKEGTPIASSDGGARLGRILFDGTAEEISNLQLKIRDIKADNLTNAQNGVIICLDEGGGARRSAVTIGVKINLAGTAAESSGQRMSTNAYFDKNELNLLGCPNS